MLLRIKKHSFNPLFLSFCRGQNYPQFYVFDIPFLGEIDILILILEKGQQRSIY